MTLHEAYETTPPQDGKWAWYAAFAENAGCSTGHAYRWHRRTGREPRYVIPTECRWCGAKMTAEWAERVASRLCFDCCREAGREGVR